MDVGARFIEFMGQYGLILIAIGIAVYLAWREHKSKKRYLNMVMWMGRQGMINEDGFSFLLHMAEDDKEWKRDGGADADTVKKTYTHSRIHAKLREKMKGLLDGIDLETLQKGLEREDSSMADGD